MSIHRVEWSSPREGYEDLGSSGVEVLREISRTAVSHVRGSLGFPRVRTSRVKMRMRRMCDTAVEQHSATIPLGEPYSVEDPWRIAVFGESDIPYAEMVFTSPLSLAHLQPKLRVLSGPRKSVRCKRARVRLRYYSVRCIVSSCRPPSKAAARAAAASPTERPLLLCWVLDF